MSGIAIQSHPISQASSACVTAIHCFALRVAGFLDRVSRFMNEPTGGSSASSPSMGPGGPDTPVAVLVIDASPSMDDTDWPPSRLKAAKDAAKAYVIRLSKESPRALVAVVAYHERADTLCAPTPVQRTDDLRRVIDGIKTQSATNITAGLQNALAILKRSRGPSQVVLLTDGMHNHGPQPHQVAKKLRQVATLEIVGIGGSPQDVDEYLLKDLASAFPDGQKRYRWIGHKEQLVNHFEALAGRLARS